jgi:hypothetical protein
MARTDELTPIFIFSIQRSGSTLIQRIIGAHPGVSTVSEPWLLLPLLYTLRSRGVDAEYPHALMVSAIEDFYGELPDGRKDYERELHDFVMRLYTKAAGDDARFFLDKTPNYNLIAGEIIELFPEAKFVFLWRNPLSILSSIVETWQEGHWHPTIYREDLFIGLPRLIAAFREHSANVHPVLYEDLVGEDEEHWRALMAYIGIEFDPGSLDRFTETTLRGRHGDPTGSRRYATVSTEPVEKWKQTICNPIRREWALRYLRFLGRRNMGTMGYDAEELMAELATVGRGTRAIIPDLAWLISDIAREPLRIGMRHYGVGGPSVVGELFKANRE